MTEAPLVSVVMPVFNGGSFLRGSIESILNQSFRDFEFIIIDDGSSDDSLSVIRGYAQLDDRIKVYSKKNHGISRALNDGILVARGRWIARMDSDDISVPERFSEILKIIKGTNSNICGCWIQLFDGGGTKGIVRYPSTSEAIKYALLFGTAFAHPAIFIEAKLAKNNLYNPSFDGAEDYELWSRLATQNIRMGNVPAPLLKYRIHKGQISSLFNQEQSRITQEIKKSYWNNFFLKTSQNFLDLKLLLCSDFPSTKGDYLERINAGFKILIESTSDVEAQKVIKQNWWIAYVNYSPLSKHIYKNWTQVKDNFSIGLYLWGLVLFYALTFFGIHKASRSHAWVMRWYLRIYRSFFS